MWVGPASEPREEGPRVESELANTRVIEQPAGREGLVISLDHDKVDASLQEATQRKAQTRMSDGCVNQQRGRDRLSRTIQTADHTSPSHPFERVAGCRALPPCKRQ